MRNGMVEVRVGFGSDVAAVLRSTELVEMRSRQYILLELRYSHAGNNIVSQFKTKLVPNSLSVGLIATASF